MNSTISALLTRTLALLLVISCLVAPLLASDGSLALDPYQDEYADVHEGLRFPVLLSRQGDVVTIDNVRDGVVEDGRFVPQWRRMTVDLSAVKAARMTVMSFDAKLFAKGGHAQIVFDFAEGALSDDRGNDPDGLYFSFEAFRGRGVPYRPLTSGTNDEYGSIWIIESGRSAYDKIFVNNPKVEFGEIDLDRDALVRLLEAFLARSLDRDTLDRTPYHTFRNSCITNQFDVFEEVLPRVDGQRYDRTWRPSRIIRRLESMGLVSERYELQVPDEYARWLEDGTIPEPAPPQNHFAGWDDLHYHGR